MIKQKTEKQTAHQTEQVKIFQPSDDILASDHSQPAVDKKEVGGRQHGPEPTRYGDWEKNGRCIDF